MFEAQVLYYLKHYLGKYVHGLDAESLKISVWNGDVELRNLALKPEALQELDLPITVKAGLLGKLTLKVPWARLGQQPVTVEFDRLYILAGPRQEANEPAQADLRAFAEAAQKAEVDAKVERVTAAEQAWLQGLAARAEAAIRQAAAATAAGGPGDAAKPGGADGSGAPRSNYWSLESIIGPILGNLQLVVTNVHVRYEDDVAWPGHNLALGLLLSRLAAQTVDEAGKPAWVGGSLLKLLRKAITLSSLATYLDVDQPLAALPRGITSWAAMTQEQWDALFLPEHHAPRDNNNINIRGGSGPAGGKGAGAGEEAAAGGRWGHRLRRWWPPRWGRRLGWLGCWRVQGSR